MTVYISFAPPFVQVVAAVSPRPVDPTRPSHPRAPYAITYTVADLSGNVALPAVRLVAVVCATVSRTSMSGISHAWPGLASLLAVPAVPQIAFACLLHVALHVTQHRRTAIKCMCHMSLQGEVVCSEDGRTLGPGDGSAVTLNSLTDRLSVTAEEQQGLSCSVGGICLGDAATRAAGSTGEDPWALARSCVSRPATILFFISKV